MVVLPEVFRSKSHHQVILCFKKLGYHLFMEILSEAYRPLYTTTHLSQKYSLSTHDVPGTILVLETQR